MASMEESFTTLLTGSAALAALVGTRIYTSLAPLDNAYPRVVVTYGEMEPDTTHGGLSNLRRWLWSVQIHARRYSEVAAIRDVLIPLVTDHRDSLVQGSTVLTATHIPLTEDDGSEQTVEQISMQIETWACKG